jgi:hypothetical protein
MVRHGVSFLFGSPARFSTFFKMGPCGTWPVPSNAYVVLGISQPYQFRMPVRLEVLAGSLRCPWGTWQDLATASGSPEFA